MERAVHKSVHHESYGARGSHESGHDYEGRVARACHAQPGRVRGHDSEVCPMKTLLPRAERAGHVNGREEGRNPLACGLGGPEWDEVLTARTPLAGS